LPTSSIFSTTLDMIALLDEPLAIKGTFKNQLKHQAL